MSLLIKGVTKLSELGIDVDKDWQGHTLTNLKVAIAAGQPLSIEQMLALVGFAWTGLGAPAEECCEALTQDADYVYAGLCVDPARVIKIAKTTMLGKIVVGL